ncbi:uncharacterized protein EV422DRAFT_402134 [Fimicolochytrium jonesii]|uniref:uncharacterized protein n=1 Tax=Fimicolochytrium jonesii TaxID=1396493 RepID=UPI0022FE5D6A|nr:uncharacterized protein EV422DRAFT_402134 [Fimicolochytrium jonesii]KAI8822522.1 hypothetical protein EV422DRAFT_402134 [Fimicolochytrium jonesii]
MSEKGQPRIRLSIKLGAGSAPLSASSSAHQGQSSAGTPGARKNNGPRKGMSASEAARAFGVKPTRPASAADRNDDNKIRSRKLSSEHEPSVPIKLLFKPPKIYKASAIPSVPEHTNTSSRASHGDSAEDSEELSVNATSPASPKDLSRTSSGKRPAPELTERLNPLAKRVRLDDALDHLGDDGDEDDGLDLDDGDDMEMGKDAANSGPNALIEGSTANDGRLPQKPTRKTKSRGKGFTPKRRVTDGKGVWKPKKKSLHIILSKILVALKRKDQYGFFLDPVDTSVITDYLTVVKEPMDFGTMERKIQRRVYRTCAEFKHDFHLVVTNAKTYNPPDTVIVRETEKLEEYGNRLIEREEKNVADEPVVPEDGSAHASTNTSEVGAKRGEVKRKYSKRYKPAEELALRLCAQVRPDGTSSKDRSWNAHKTSRFDEILHRFSSARKHSLKEVDKDELFRTVLESGPYKYWESPEKIPLESTLRSHVYGSAEGEAYVSSLRKFARTLPAEIQRYADESVNKASGGAVEIMDTAVGILQQPETLMAPVTAKVRTEWGTVDVGDRVRHLEKAFDRLIEIAEVELYRKEGVDIRPILPPAAIGVQDPELEAQLQRKDPSSLLGSNSADLVDWYAKHVNRLSGGQVTIEQEAMVAERVRRRLLQLVCQAPESEFQEAQGIPSVEVIQNMYTVPAAVAAAGIVRPAVPTLPM